jgi:hypothetical protein
MKHSSDQTSPACSPLCSLAVGAILGWLFFPRRRPVPNVDSALRTEDNIVRVLAIDSSELSEVVERSRASTLVLGT